MAGQLLTMPEPLRLDLGGALGTPLFTGIAGQPAHVILDGIDACPAARIPLLMLAPIAAAYESEMFGTDTARRATWRADRYSPCSRQHAGKYLAFLASLGYQLAPIEQAVADGVPYTGDNPEDPLSADGEGDDGCGDALAGSSDPAVTEDNAEPDEGHNAEPDEGHSPDAAA